jgi:two-component system sensor histidine kinase VanS
MRLTVLYSGLFLASGIALLAAMYLIFRSNTGTDLIVPTRHGPAGTGLGHGAGAGLDALDRVRLMYEQSVRRTSHRLHQGLLESGIALAIMGIVSIVLGWLVAGRVLRPLRAITAKTQAISASNLNERLALVGPQDELKDLADTVDGLLARLEAHVAEQQRFAANASHELRTPLAITQTLLEVARNDPSGSRDELVERLHFVNARAIELTEALLLLSRADQRSFVPEHVDLSLCAEEATERLLTLAEMRGITIESAGEAAATTGSPSLLLQMTTNLIHNAIVHNLPADGSVWVRTSADAGMVALSVENTGERLTPQLVATLAEPFQRGSARTRAGHDGAGLGLAIVQRIAEAHGGTLTLVPRAAGGLRVTVRLPVSRG